MKRFEGKVAFVAGGAAGIGAAAAERLAHDGAAVAVFDIDGSTGERLVDDISTSGGTAIALQGDLAEDDSVRHALERTCETFGGLDYLVNSAFIRNRADGNVVDTPPEVWDRIMDVNLTGFARTCRYAIPIMIERGGGAIVNLTSGVDRAVTPTLVSYVVSKAGIIALTRSTAVAFGPQGIRVNAVAPGVTATANSLAFNGPALFEAWAQQSPKRRTGQPEEVGAVIAFLLSDDASMISGELVHVDGGRGISG
jgi:NAD(P)-dependent dehydrogenase (short-subunit alcohol dehydrogenase family)